MRCTEQQECIPGQELEGDTMIRNCPLKKTQTNSHSNSFMLGMFAFKTGFKSQLIKKSARIPEY